MIKRIQFFQTQSQKLRQSLGHDVLEAQIKERKKQLCVTFTSEQKKEAKESIKKVINQPHIPSPKEQVSGIHYSAMALGLLQFRKVHDNQGNNFNLYEEEMRGRKEEKF
jgi:hypothetical protein